MGTCWPHSAGLEEPAVPGACAWRCAGALRSHALLIPPGTCPSSRRLRANTNQLILRRSGKWVRLVRLPLTRGEAAEPGGRAGARVPCVPSPCGVVSGETEARCCFWVLCGSQPRDALVPCITPGLESTQLHPRAGGSAGAHKAPPCPTVPVLSRWPHWCCVFCPGWGCTFWVA